MGKNHGDPSNNTRYSRELVDVYVRYVCVYQKIIIEDNIVIRYSKIQFLYM